MKKLSVILVMILFLALAGFFVYMSKETPDQTLEDELGESKIENNEISSGVVTGNGTGSAINFQEANKTDSSRGELRSFTIEMPNLVVRGRNLSRVEIWAIPDGSITTFISSVSYSKLGDAKLVSDGIEGQVWVFSIPANPVESPEIFAMSFDEKGKRLGQIPLAFEGRYSVQSVLWDFSSYLEFDRFGNDLVLDTIADWEVFKNPDLGIEFRHPKGWYPKNSEYYTLVNLFPPSFVEGVESEYPVLAFVKMASSYSSHTLQEVVEERLSPLVSIDKDCRSIALSQLPAVICNFIDGYGGNFARDIYVDKNGEKYEIVDHMGTFMSALIVSTLVIN